MVWCGMDALGIRYGYLLSYAIKHAGSRNEGNRNMDALRIPPRSLQCARCLRARVA